MNNKSVSIKEIRKLAAGFSAGSLERCLDSQLDVGENVCMRRGDSEEIVSLLAKAVFVRNVVEREEVSINNAVRVLGARMRAYSGCDGQAD